MLALLESFLPIAGIVLLGGIIGWEVALGGPPLIAAVALPFVSVLRLDYRICLLQAAVGAAGFLAVVGLTLGQGPEAPSLTLAQLVPQFGKSVLLVGFGIIAALIAHQSRRRLQEVIQQQVERETVQESLRTRTAEYQRVADALLGKNELISILSHDLRAPLDGVASLAQLMARAPERFEAADIRKYAEEIGGTAHDLRELLDNLVVWAELKADLKARQSKPLFLAQVVSPIVRLFEPAVTAKHLEVEEKVAADLKIYGDEAAVATVVRNLVSNAVKSTPAGGRVTLWVDDTGSPERLALVVADTGPGFQITPSRSDHGGNAGGVAARSSVEGRRPELGLALCRQLLTQLDGSLDIRSRPGGGTEARVWFLRRDPACGSTQDE